MNASTTALRPLFLVEEFAFGPPAHAGQGAGFRLNHRQIRYTLWLKAEGASDRQIAADLGVSRSTVLATLRRAEFESGVFGDCRFVLLLRLGRNRQAKRWVCRFCGVLYRTSAPAMIHAWSHVFNPQDNWW